MPSASTIRLQIETALASRIPAALTPQPRVVYPVAETGIAGVDALLDGGIPVGAVTELTGLESSGRSSLAIAFVGRRTREGKVCAWIDVSNTLQPESAASAGVDLRRLLWVHCGGDPSPSAPQVKSTFTLPKECLIPPQPKRGLYSGGWGGHPRAEARGLSAAMRGVIQPESSASRGTEPLRRGRREPQTIQLPAPSSQKPTAPKALIQKPWNQLDRALRVTDLLLQGGGFSAIVLDMGSIAPEYGSRVPLATWFRYRAAAERTQSSILLLTQHPCAKSSAGLVLRLRPTDAWHDETTVFTGFEFEIELSRQRFAPASNLVPLRKGPQRETGNQWSSRCSWAGRR
jgi:hypothetical protein